MFGLQDLSSNLLSKIAISVFVNKLFVQELYRNSDRTSLFPAPFQFGRTFNIIGLGPYFGTFPMISNVASSFGPIDQFSMVPPQLKLLSLRSSTFYVAPPHCAFEPEPSQHGLP
jgi:hypothetical protein